MTGAPSVRRVIVGTAGHIDHGKTTLVERLTGTRTDRLPEERARGMTIDVGYAEFRLPDGTEAGLIDVPGHERLVHTMVAGATAMDVVLLVVAADDGPMLQTREHLDILDLLGVTRAVVALTKIDIAGPARTAAVADEVRVLLAGTSLTQAPIVPLSSVTGEGLEALRTALAQAIPTADRAEDPPWAFRMPVMRAFVAPGRGTVVTGIPLAGRVVVGAEVELLPGARGCRVRGVQVHHRASPQAYAGQRTALLLTDLPVVEVHRGMVVAQAGSLTPAARVGARLRVLPGLRKPLRHALRVRMHVGSGDVAARLHLLDGGSLNPGALSAVELEAAEPLLVAPGDRFVLRTENDAQTLGGGVIVARLAERLPRCAPGTVARLLAEAEHLHDPSARLRGALERTGERGVGLPDLAVATGIQHAALPALLERLKAAGGALERERLWFTTEAFAALRQRVLSALLQVHAADPALAWIALTTLRAGVRRTSPECFDLALSDLQSTGDVRHDAQRGWAARDHAPDLAPEERRRLEAVLARLALGAGQPPEEGALGAAAGLSRPQVLRALNLLEARRQAVRIGPQWFAAAWLDEARRALADLGASSKAFTVSEACAAWGTSRRFGIPLLEHFDRQGVTKRTGATRVLRAPT